MLQLDLDKKYSSETIREYSYRVMRKNIIYLNIKPGEIISENIVAEALDSSRTPIRETFSKLLSDGLLEIYPQRGTYISLIDMNRVKESLFMRLILEEAIMKLACENFSEENLFLLESNFNQQLFCHSKNKFAEMFELDNNMHEIIYKSCNMGHIWQAIKNISADQYRIRYLKLLTKLRYDETIEEHSAIIKAIKNKNSITGCKIAYHHVENLNSDSEIVKQKYNDYFKN